MPSGLIIAKASAGSGKTFSLVNHYLHLALQNPEAFDHILGITFTNKAAAEMKVRALKEIKKIAAGEANEHTAILERTLGLSASDLKERAQKLEHLMLHRFYRIRFSTIDALLQMLLRHMAYELGLSASYALETDIDGIKKELLKLFYQSLDEDELTQHWLMEYIDERLKDRKSWDVESEVSRFVDVLFQENSREIFGNHWPHVEKARRFKETVIGELNSLWQLWVDASRAIVEKLNRYDLTLSIFSTRENYVILLKLLSEEPSDLRRFLSNWKKFDEKVKDLFFNVSLNIAPKKSGVKKEEKVRFQMAVDDRLGDLFEQWRQSIVDNFPRFKTLYLISRELYRYGLLGKFSSLFDDWRASTHTQLIQDAPRILTELLKTGDADFIYEKTSVRLRHILLDEFQDTSQAQWRSLLPLLKESLASGNLVYAVGDPKQSIYAWRGANASIMQYELPELSEQMGLRPVVQTLNVNWRSAPQIVAFNNKLFRFLVDQAPDYLLEKLGIPSQRLPEFEKAVESLKETYSSLEQVPAEKNLSLQGKIDVVWLQPREEKPSDTSTHPHDGSTGEGNSNGTADLNNIRERALQDVLNRWADEGLRPGDIAVLVRTNDEVNDHVLTLNRLISSGGLHFNNARAVSGALWNFENSKLASYCLAFLTYISDPTQHIHKAMLFFWALRLKGLSAAQASMLLSNTAEIESYVGKLTIPVGSVPDRLRLWAEEYLPKLPPEEREREAAYVCRLIDQAVTYEKKYPSTPTGFISWLQESKQVGWVAFGHHENLLRVATIHSVKGLEFDGVVLSLSPSSAFENPREVTWYPLNDLITQYQTEFFPFRRNPSQHRLALTEGEFYQDYFKQFGEALNVFYVGCTRARIRLCLLLPKGLGNNTSTSWFEIIWNVKERNMEKWEAIWRPLEDAGVLNWKRIPSEDGTTQRENV
jgi:ATP-dependent exoDNAse (exonuclease V) beta subunit